MDKNQPDYNAWTGNRQGLYVKGSSSADFDLYIYRDGYTSILAEYPANQYGTLTPTRNASISALDSIHHNDRSDCMPALNLAIPITRKFLFHLES